MRASLSPSRTKSFFFQADDGIRALTVTGVQTCALPLYCEVDIVRPLRLCRARVDCGRAEAAVRYPPRNRADPGGGAAVSQGKIGRASCRERDESQFGCAERAR